LQSDPNWPFQTPKTSQNPQKPCGGSWGNPYNMEPGGHTCKDTLNLLMCLETWMIYEPPLKKFNLQPNTLTPQTHWKAMAIFSIAIGIWRGTLKESFDNNSPFFWQWRTKGRIWGWGPDYYCDLESIIEVLVGVKK